MPTKRLISAVPVTPVGTCQVGTRSVPTCAFSRQPPLQPDAAKRQASRRAGRTPTGDGQTERAEGERKRVKSSSRSLSKKQNCSAN